MPYKKETELPVSYRHGKLQPSVRFADTAAKAKAMRPNWRIGIDKPVYESTLHAASKEAGSVPPEVLALRQPGIDKNASDKRGIFGDGNGHYSDPKVVFGTTYKSTHNPRCSAMAEDYKRNAPAFDRLSANKTNYSLSLSNEHHGLRSASHLAHDHPEAWPARKGFEKSVLGGWTKPGDDRYCVDELARGSVMRGGGGGEGSLGVQFNIVTNAPDPQARVKVAMRTGPRVSLNVKDPWRMGADRFGQHKHAAEHGDGKIDILSGKMRAVRQAPPMQTAQTLLRPDKDILRTRPW